MRTAIIAAVSAAGIALAGCNTTQVAATSGGVAGALIVAALGGNPAQIALGGAIGAGTGWVVSQLIPQSPGVCQAVNQFGQPIYVTPGGQFTTTPTGNPLLVQC